MTAVSEERKQGPRCPHGRVDQHHDRDPVEVKSSEARAPGRVGVVGGGAGASRSGARATLPAGLPGGLSLRPTP